MATLAPYQINLREFRKNPDRFQNIALTLDTALFESEDFALAEPLTLTFSLIPKSVGFRLLGSTYGKVFFMDEYGDLARLKAVKIPLDEQYVYLTPEKLSREYQSRDRDMQLDDIYEDIDEHGVLDLRDLIHQLLLLEDH
jgi:hypothetical protein